MLREDKIDIKETLNVEESTLKFRFKLRSRDNRHKISSILPSNSKNNRVKELKLLLNNE